MPNDKKSKIIFIYGLPATGKLTVAKDLAKMTDIPLCHNHMIFDLVFKIFKWQSREGQKMREKVYADIVKLSLQSGASIIFTHAHASAAQYPFGVSSNTFVRKIERMTKTYGGLFCPVYLLCSEKELYKRVVHPSRKTFNKTNTIAGMKWWIASDIPAAQLPTKNTFVIDNTKLSSKKVAEMIKKNFKL